MKRKPVIKKSLLLEKIVEQLTEGLNVLEKAAQASHAEATHESSKAENKYDTRGLEAAYLAGGQARQARELLESIKTYSTLQLRDFKEDEAIDLTALVDLEMDGTSSLFFLGPKNGGLEIIWQKQEITVITPQSPLGQNLMGKKVGSKWTVKLGGRATDYGVRGVS